jgi:hypothetical protein
MDRAKPHALKNHKFHVHQRHFLAESQDDFERNGSSRAPPITSQYPGMIQVPFWDQNPNPPYPSVKLRIDVSLTARMSCTENGLGEGGLAGEDQEEDGETEGPDEGAHPVGAGEGVPGSEVEAGFEATMLRELERECGEPQDGE